MANLLEKTRKITSILKRTDEQLQFEMPYNDIAQQLADIIPVSYTHLDVYKRQLQNAQCFRVGRW